MLQTLKKAGRIIVIGGISLLVTFHLTWAQKIVSHGRNVEVPLETLTIEINPSGAGSVSKTPNKTNYDTGEEVQLKANPSGQYEFLNWSGDVDRYTYNPLNIHMEENRTITANFVIQNANKISSPNTPSGSGSAQTGEWITFHSGGANSSIGGSVEYLYDWGDGHVSEWGNSTRTYAYGRAGTYKVKVRARSTAEPNTVSSWSATKSVSVTGPDKHILTITVKPGGGGNVQITPDKNGYDDGDQVQLRAIPNTGYRFDRWTDGLKSTSNPITIYMLKSRSITANFVEDGGGGGGGDTETVSTPDKPDGPTTALINSDVQFTTENAVSSLGHEVEYQFDFGDGNQSAWGDGQATHNYTNAGTYNVKARARCKQHTNIVSSWSSALAIEVTEQTANYVLTVSSDPEAGGVVQVDPDKESYNQDEKVQLRAIPNANYHFDHWSGDISPYTDNPIYIYMRRDRTIIANFVFEGGEVVSVPDTIIGPTEAYMGVELSFITGGSHSSLGHPVEYQFDWGDGTLSVWGDTVQQHTFITTGSFQVRARARCQLDTGVQSAWSESIEVVVTELLEGYVLTAASEPIDVGVVQIRPRKNVYAENEHVTVYAIPTNGNGIFDNNIYLEAETGILSGNFWVESDTSASEGQYIFGAQGRPKDGDAVYQFQVDEAGSYYIWGRCYALADTEDSFFFLVDGGDTLTWHLDVDYNTWKWQKASDQHQVKQFNFSVGQHELRIIKRDKRARLDKLIITSDENFQPVGKMAVEKEERFFFLQWEGDIAGTENPFQVVMDSDKSVIARFISSNAEMVTAPTLLAGPDSGFVKDTLSFVTGGAIDTKGSSVEYQFDWGNGNFSEWGDSSATYSYFSAQMYEIKSRARSVSDTSVVSGWSTPFQVNIIAEAVTTPFILNAPDSGFVGKNVSFIASGAVDNKGEPVEYQFDWGEGNYSSWGDSARSYLYSDSGAYAVKVRARSLTDSAIISDWSEEVTVIITHEPIPTFSIYLTIVPEEKGSVAKNPDKAEYAQGDTVELLAVPVEGYELASWSGDVESSDNPIFLVMNRDYNIIANFAEIVENVSVPATPTGPDSGMVGEQLTFSTTGSVCNLGHDVEYQFDWGDSTLSDWGKNTRQHIFGFSDTMRVRVRARCKENISVVSDWSDVHIVVIVKTFNYILNVFVEPEGSGSVNRTPFKSNYEAGEVVILSPLPASGFLFDSWTGDVTGIQNPEFLVMDGDKNVTAHFKNVTGVKRAKKGVPESFSLSQNYPNPFNPTTSINFQLPKSCYLSLNIYNIQGQLVRNLLDGNQQAGYYTVHWDAKNDYGNVVPSGVYLYQIHTSSFTRIKKMMLLR